jgi:Kef-type K+ transport system membrane component KefB
MAAAIEIGQIVQDFTVIMIVASAMALISFKLKQPMVIGYIGAGIIIGPYTPPFSFSLMSKSFFHSNFIAETFGPTEYIN